MNENNPFHDGQQDGDQIERPSPHDQSAEMAVLGAMLLNRHVIDDVTQIVKGKHYYKPAHELIHNTIVDLHSRGDIADPITVSAELARRDDLARAGGVGYPHALVQEVPTSANAEYYAEIVREKAMAREFATTVLRASNDLAAGRGAPQEIMDMVQASILSLADEQADDGLALMAESMGGTLDKLEQIANGGEVAGVPTGFADLDALTNGLHGGQMIIVAGRPGLGKSTLAADFLRSAAIGNGLASVIFSLEMSRDEINMRVLSAEARVGLHHMRKGSMTDDDWTRVARRMPDVTGAPLWVDDSPNLTMAQIQSKCRRLKDRHDLRLVVIDYLQLLRSGTGRRYESRQAEVTDLSRSIKLLAKELDIPIVALAQLNRGPEQRTDKMPMVSDLRESGSLEQDADLIILLHREDAYEKDSPRAGEADLIVGKHRNGPTATITLAAQLHYSRFVDMTRDPDGG